MSFWHTLGISPTADKAEIRHAYAEKTKICHPEEDPQGFDALHKAFLAAMQYARRNAGTAQLSPAELPQLDNLDFGGVLQADGQNYQRRKKARQAIHRQRVKLVRQQRRMVEQQILEEYAKEQLDQQELYIPLGMGCQEGGQQFDFSGIDDQQPEQADAAQPMDTQPDALPSFEERAWQNTPDGGDWD